MSIVNTRVNGLSFMDVTDVKNKHLISALQTDPVNTVVKSFVPAKIGGLQQSQIDQQTIAALQKLSSQNNYPI